MAKWLRFFCSRVRQRTSAQETMQDTDTKVSAVSVISYSFNSEIQELMRQQFIISFILATVFGVALLIKRHYYPVLSGHNAYYFFSIFWICGLLIAIFTVHLIWQSTTCRQRPQLRKTTVFWPNRRRSYRIIYPDFASPVLVVEQADNLAKRNLEYPVFDLSQDGICFLDDGSLGSVESVHGHIRFENGNRIVFSGKLIRRKRSQISIQLTHPIDWSVILEEQRRLLAILKPE